MSLCSASITSTRSPSGVAAPPRDGDGGGEPGSGTPAAVDDMTAGQYALS
jgi:hypothetical protein